jgi:hypothetical protein
MAMTSLPIARAPLPMAILSTLASNPAEIPVSSEPSPTNAPAVSLLVEGLYTIPGSVFKGTLPVVPVLKITGLEALVASVARTALVALVAVPVTSPVTSPVNPLEVTVPGNVVLLVIVQLISITSQFYYGTNTLKDEVGH